MNAIAAKEPQRQMSQKKPAEQAPVSARRFRHPLHRVQNALGNRAVQRLIQAKLTVGASDNEHEREADRVARTVLNMSDATVSRMLRGMGVQEEDKDEMLHKKPLAGSISPFVYRQLTTTEDEEELVQATEDYPHTGSFDAGEAVETQLGLSKGRGSPLPDTVRAFMEPRFGVDFGQVRVHADAEAMSMSEAVGAQAFTHGRDVYFGAGHSPTDLALTAHELTHVVQQTGTMPLQANRLDDLALAESESSVQRVCGACAAGGTPCASCAVQEGPIQRKEVQVPPDRQVKRGAAGHQQISRAPKSVQRYSLDEFTDDVASVGEAAVEGVEEMGPAVVSGAEAVGGTVVSGAEAGGEAVVSGAEVVVSGAEAVGSAAVSGADPLPAPAAPSAPSRAPAAGVASAPAGPPRAPERDAPPPPQVIAPPVAVELSVASANTLLTTPRPPIPSAPGSEAPAVAGGGDPISSLAELAASVRQLAPAVLVAQLAQVRSGASGVASDIRTELRAHPPQRTRPTGDPEPRTQASTTAHRAPLGAPTQRVARTPPAEGIATGAPFTTRTKRIPPAAQPAIPTVKGDTSGKATANDAAMAHNALASLPTQDPGLTLPPAPAPTLELTADAHPAVSRQQQERVEQALDQAQAEGLDQAAQPRGEDNIHPAPTGDVLWGRLSSQTPAADTGRRATAPTLTAKAAGPAAAAGGRDPAGTAARQLWGERLAPELERGHGELENARARTSGEREAAQQRTDAAIEAQIAQAAAEQDSARWGTLERSSALRQQWRDAEGQLRTDAANQARATTQDGIDEVQRHRRDAEQQAADHLRRGEEEITRLRSEADNEARATQARAGSQSFLEWAADQVNAALAAARQAIASIFERARAAVHQVLTQARTSAMQAIQWGRQTIVAVVRRVGQTLVDIGDRVLAQLPALRARFRQLIDSAVAAATSLVQRIADRLGHAVQRILDNLASALDALLQRLERMARGIIDRLQAFVDRIIQPIEIHLDPIEVFGAIPVRGKSLMHLSTGDIPILKKPIVTKVGVFFPLVTMRTDADVAFRGGQIGPGILEHLTVTVAPFQDRYQGNGALRVDGDISGGTTLTGVLAGSFSYMGLLGAGLQGGTIMPFTLTGSGSMSAAAHILYDHGDVSFQDRITLGTCLRAMLGVDAFLRFILFTGLPVKLPTVGPGQGTPDEDLPVCELGQEPDPNLGGGRHGEHPESPPEDSNLYPYAELKELRGQWHLDDYEWAGCLAKTVAVRKQAGEEASAEVDEADGTPGPGYRGGGGESGGGGSSGSFDIAAGFRELFTSAAVTWSTDPPAATTAMGGPTRPVGTGGKKRACRFPTGMTEDDPISMTWYKPYDTYEEPLILDAPGLSPEEKMYWKLSGPVDSPHGDYKIGVRKWPTKKDKFQWIGGRQDAKKDEFKELLEEDGFDWRKGALQADHVLDCAFGGQDHFNNLWPLDKSINEGAGLCNSFQGVHYSNPGDPTPRLLTVQSLPKRWFIIEKLDVGAACVP